MLRSNLLIPPPSSGPVLIMHHPLESDLSTLPTGQTIAKSGSVQFSTYHSHRAASFAASAYLKTTSGPMVDWTQGVTYCVWCYFGTNGGTRTLVSAGSSSGAISMSRNGNNQYNTFGNTFSATIGQNAWHHAAATLDDTGTIITIYRDGAQVGTYTRAAAPAIGAVEEMAIGGNVPGYTYNTRAVEMRDARIYQGVLSAAQISAIYNGEL